MKRMKRAYPLSFALAIALSTAFTASAADYGVPPNYELPPPPPAATRDSGGAINGNGSSNGNGLKPDDIIPEIVIGSDTASTVPGVQLPENCIVINFNVSGEFGFNHPVEISAAQLKNAGLKASGVMLFYIADDGTITEKPNAVRVNANGSVTITFKHASSYVLAETAPLGAEDVSSWAAFVAEY
jgi:hypothetical protein